MSAKKKIVSTYEMPIEFMIKSFLSNIFAHNLFPPSLSHELCTFLLPLPLTKTVRVSEVQAYTLVEGDEIEKRLGKTQIR